MPPVIIGISRSKPVTPSYEELMKLSAQTVLENVVPDTSIYVYVYGLGATFSLITDDPRGLNFDILGSKDLSAFGLPGAGLMKELEVRVPSSQSLKALNDAQRYGPVLFAKVKIVDPQKGTSNPWPLCILLNIPVILGVTRERVKKDRTTTPKEVYADLLKQNLANLVKGTTPGSIRRGSAREDPRPDVFIYGCNFANPKIKPVDIPTIDSLFVNRRYCTKICTVEFDFSIGPLQKKFQFDLQEIGVSLPTMADLQNSSNYVRNAILMAFGVRIENGRGREKQAIPGIGRCGCLCRASPKPYRIKTSYIATVIILQTRFPVMIKARCDGTWGLRIVNRKGLWTNTFRVRRRNCKRY